MFEGWIRRPVTVGLERLPRWFLDYDLLFVAYTACLGIVFFSGSIYAGQRIFLVAVVPFALLPSLFEGTSATGGSAGPSDTRRERFGRLFGAARSVLFWGALVYLSAITLPELVRSGPGRHAAEIHSRLAFEILVFLAITAFLVARYAGFLDRFFLLFGAIVAINAIATMIAFVIEAGPVPAYLSEYRLMPVFGLPGNMVATTLGLSYALVVIGVTTTAVTLWRSRWRRATLLVASAILLPALLWTQARGPSSAAVAGFLTLLVMKAPLRTRVTRHLLARSVVVLFVVLDIALAVPVTHKMLLSRADGYRFEIWNRYLALARQRPLIGYGELANTHITVADGTVINHPHNLVLSAQVLGGVVASSAMLVIILGGLVSAFAYYRRSGNATPACLAVAVAVAGTTDFSLVVSYPNWYWATLWLPFGIGIGTEVWLRAQPATPPPT